MDDLIDKLQSEKLTNEALNRKIRESDMEIVSLCDCVESLRVQVVKYTKAAREEVADNKYKKHD